MATIESNFESICINPNDDLVLYEKEIIRSRIEKFLYAICSLDSNDLPTPLSRIEELYNCLVTGGDIPTFTPLSRAEKFVMAMLGAYDVELLPTPISRSETLMKKIATGDNNLDDVDNLQSRYEFLLAYIIKAGGFNGGSEDFYYNLTSLTSGFTTIYNTFDMPVKNAVLRGQTLVNVNRSNFTAESNITTDYTNAIVFFDADMKANTTYTIIAYSDNQYEFRLSQLVDNTREVALGDIHEVGIPFVFTTHTSFTGLRGYLKGDSLNIPQGTEIKILIIEGDHSNEDIPYFTGMQSVKMPVLTTSNEDGTKTNILTVNEEVELRGIGDVQNTLDLMTGEVTERIGEVVLNGSENWILNTIDNTTISLYCNGFGSKPSSLVMCAKLKSERYDGVRTSTVGGFSITLDRNITGINDINTFKNWLQNNNLTIVYPLEVETIKTVDLSTVDQDGKETELSTFDDITHVTVSSEGLIPTGEITVATKNAADVIDASVMSLRMDDILNSQRTLEGPANAQSDDIDVAMLGVTDIYEQLL